MSSRGPIKGGKRQEKLDLLDSIALDLKVEYEDAKSQETKDAIHRLSRLLSIKRHRVEHPVCRHVDCSAPTYAKAPGNPYCLKHSKEHYGKGRPKAKGPRDYSQGLRDALVTGRK